MNNNLPTEVLNSPTPGLLHLLGFVCDKHSGQFRKYTGEPYVNHVIRVANTVQEHGGTEYQIAAALCHDLLEDTDCDRKELSNILRDCDYNVFARTNICNMVRELTDIYTHESFPETNRAMRKRLEAERLWKISDEAQTIKYADLLDNTSDIMQNDAKFGELYLKEKEYILSKMVHGDIELYYKVSNHVQTEMSA
jgi:(p)ppGpp synthase/HD superfamily hydrolase